MCSKKHSLVHYLLWKLNSTQDSCKLHSATGYRVYLPATQPCTVTSTTSYRVPTGYWLHSLVHLLQQLVTECTDRLPSSQPYTVASTGYSVPTTQPCTLASTTGYRVYRLVLATQLVHSLQQLVTVCTDRLPASRPYTVASTGYSVPTTQPCTLASTTGYRVYRLVLATQPCTLASTTGYRVYWLVLAT